ncbi:hypothetical protein ABZX30_29200 [Streptomyces sp. NPDC004542]|uniref:hypothetical protein n=1 Tax=Streptomyces sp. NPDC004542 TaxID=3154281 RepID=UPI0033AEDD7E
MIRPVRVGRVRVRRVRVRRQRLGMFVRAARQLLVFANESEALAPPEVRAGLPAAVRPVTGLYR